MSQPPSPSLIEHPSLLDVQDDHQPYPPHPPQDRNAASYSARQERLAALERRLNRNRSAAESSTDASQSRSLDVTQDPQPFDDNHEKRIEFRRLVDPGIMRPNSKEVALRSLHTLSKIAENLLRDPDSPKFRQFKPTNTIIKRDLVDPKGALEYAVAMGFRPEVDHFQPYYVFHSKYVADLRIGAGILREALETAGKEEDPGLKVKMAKAEEEMRIKKAKEAFMDDRKTQMLRTERERALRRQGESARAQSPSDTASADA